MPQSKQAGDSLTTQGTQGTGSAPNSIVIDLTGMGGLTPQYWGDFFDTQTTDYGVNNRVLQNDPNSNQLAGGFFNPWIKQGYLSPSSADYTSCTFSGTAPSGPLTSVVMDVDNVGGYLIYWAESGVNIYSNITGFSSLTNIHSMASGTVLDDLELYEIGGQKTLFYSYSTNSISASSTVTFNDGTLTITASSGTYTNGQAIYFTNSGGALPPEIIANQTYFIVNVSGLAFKISKVYNGAPASFSTNGSGTSTVNSTISGGIGVYPLTGSTWTDGWLQGATYNGTTVNNPISLSNKIVDTFPTRHFMRVASNGYMYIFDGNTVHQVDGTALGGAAGTINANIYFLANASEFFMDAICYRQQMFMAVKNNSFPNQGASQDHGSMMSNRCYVAVWDMTISTTASRDVIEIPGISSIQKLYIAPNGKLRAICITPSLLGQIREYDGTSFNILINVSSGCYPAFPDGLITTDTLTMWVGTDGTLWGHGMVFNNSGESLARIGSIIAPGVGNAFLYENLELTGALIQYADIFYFGFQPNSGTSAVEILTPFDRGQTALAGNIYSGVHYLQSSTAAFYTGTRFISQLSNIKFVNLFMANGNPASLNGTVAATIYVYINGSTTAWGSFQILDTDIAMGYKRLEMNQSYVNTIQLEVVYPTSSALAESSTFHPYLAIVYYEPTNTRG